MIRLIWPSLMSWVMAVSSASISLREMLPDLDVNTLCHHSLPILVKDAKDEVDFTTLLFNLVGIITPMSWGTHRREWAVGDRIDRGMTLW